MLTIVFSQIAANDRREERAELFQGRVHESYCGLVVFKKLDGL
jgi:hypothetical protein